MKKWIKKLGMVLKHWLFWWCVAVWIALMIGDYLISKNSQEVKEQVNYVVECEYLIFTKAPETCDFVERVHIPIYMVDGAVIEEVGWKCETIKDGLHHTLHYRVYHIYRPGVYGWFVEEDPIEMLAERKSK